jgi:hypothetical protein
VEVPASGPSDQAGRDRVVVGPDADLAVAIHPQRHRQAGLERLIRDRAQQRLLDGEGLTHGPGPATDASCLILDVPPVDLGVQLSQRAHLGDGDKVVTTEPADITFDAALFVDAFDARLTVERLKPHPR